MKKPWWYFALPAFLTGAIVGGLFAASLEGPSDNIAGAVSSLKEAEYLIHNTEEYGGYLKFEDVCDRIWDDVRDALAWLEKEE